MTPLVRPTIAMFPHCGYLMIPDLPQLSSKARAETPDKDRENGLFSHFDGIFINNTTSLVLIFSFYCTCFI